jgi:hypothetical protein
LTLHSIRDWLVLIAVAASALFTGLGWRMARKRLAARYSLAVEGFQTPEILCLKAEILNRTDKAIEIDALSVRPPIGILVSDDGACYGCSVPKEVLSAARRVNRVAREIRIEPDQSFAWGLVVFRPGGFCSRRSVSIWSHIRTRRLVRRHKTKRLSATLPPKIGNAKSP